MREISSKVVALIGTLKALGYHQAGRADWIGQGEPKSEVEDLINKMRGLSGDEIKKRILELP